MNFSFVSLEHNSACNNYFDCIKNFYNKYSALNIAKYFVSLCVYQKYTSEAMYLLCKNRFLDELKKVSLEPESQPFVKNNEQRIERQTMPFQHGDLQKVNILKNNFLIWDKSPYYPYGYVLRFIIASHIKENKDYNQLCELTDKEIDNQTYKQNTLFFRYHSYLKMVRTMMLSHFVRINY